MRQIPPPPRGSDRSRRRWLAAALALAGATSTRCAHGATFAAAVANDPFTAFAPFQPMPDLPTSTLLLILRETPFWAWAVLLILIASGRRQMSERELTRAGLLIMPPAIGVLSLTSVGRAFGLSLEGYASWAAGALLALLLNALWWQQPRGLRYLRERDTVMVPGSSWPLVLMLAVFATRCAVDASLGLGWQSARDPVFVMAASAWLGLLAGSFIARAVTIWQRCAPPP